MIKKIIIPSFKTTFSRNSLKKDIQYFSTHIRYLEKKRLWDVSDFRKISWYVAELKELKKLSKDDTAIKVVNELLDITQTFESKYEKYMQLTMQNFSLKNNKDCFDAVKIAGFSDDMLFKLIEWDKRFLIAAERRILKAQAFRDDRFFERLATSIEKGTKSESKKIKKSTQELRQAVFILFLNNRYDFDNPKQIKAMYIFLKNFYIKMRDDFDKKIIHDKAWRLKLKNQIIQCDEILKILDDENRFIYKWLPIHILGKDTKKSS